jgi:hypothetical protein
MEKISGYIENLKDDAGFNGSTAERRERLTMVQMMLADKEMEIAGMLRGEKEKGIAGQLAAADFAQALDGAESKARAVAAVMVPSAAGTAEFAQALDEVESQLKHYRYAGDPTFTRL